MGLPVPLKVALLPDADGVKLVPVGALVVFQFPVHVPIGRLTPPEVRFVGNTKFMLTTALPWPATLNVPALALATPTVAATPGKTFPNARGLPCGDPADRRCWTEAVTLMPALFWARGRPRRLLPAAPASEP